MRFTIIASLALFLSLMPTGPIFAGSPETSPKPFTAEELDRYVADWPEIMNIGSKGREALTILAGKGWDMERFMYIDDHVGRYAAAVEGQTGAVMAELPPEEVELLKTRWPRINEAQRNYKPKW